MVLATFLVFAWQPADTGVALDTKGRERWKAVVGGLDRLEADGTWKDGDLILWRSEFLEGDLLPDEIPATAQPTSSDSSLRH